MYHELTTQMKKRRSAKRTVAFVLVCVLALAAWLGYGKIVDGMHEQGAASVRQAILDSAMQACAVEGSYPSSLEHLENEYGLTINHNDYIITYEAFADNIMPSVVVVAK